MGAPTALAAITVSARRGLPQHRGRHRNQQKRSDRGQFGRGFKTMPLEKINRIGHGKRYDSYTVTSSADDLGGVADDRGLPCLTANRAYTAGNPGRWPRATRTVSEPRTELRAKPGPDWIREEQVPVGQAARLSTQAATGGRLRHGRPIARSSPSASSVRCGARRCSRSVAISSPRWPAALRSGGPAPAPAGHDRLRPVPGRHDRADGSPQHPVRHAVRPAVLHRADWRTVLRGAHRAYADVLPGDIFVLGSAVGNITYQAGQILGFDAGAVVVAVLDPHKTLGIDAATLGVSALIVLIGV
jgi:hypothetical protein